MVHGTFPFCRAVQVQFGQFGQGDLGEGAARAAVDKISGLIHDGGPRGHERRTRRELEQRGE